MKKVIVGIKMSNTRALTRLPVAPPIITAMASQIHQFYGEKPWTQQWNPQAQQALVVQVWALQPFYIFASCSRIFSKISSDSLHAPISRASSRVWWANWTLKGAYTRRWEFSTLKKIVASKLSQASEPHTRDKTLIGLSYNWFMKDCS